MIITFPSCNSLHILGTYTPKTSLPQVLFLIPFLLSSPSLSSLLLFLFFSTPFLSSTSPSSLLPPLPTPPHLSYHPLTHLITCSAYMYPDESLYYLLNYVGLWKVMLSL